MSRLGLALLLMASCHPPESPPQAPRTLRVLVYPYIPTCPGVEGHAATEARLEAALAERGIAADVDITDPDGLLYGRTEALFVEGGYDVVEIDTMLLDGIVDHIQSLPVDLARVHQAARAPVTRNEQTLGMPHWLCGFFLYSHDPSVAQVRHLPELRRALTALEGLDLVGDASSSWDLPALYIDAWHDHHPGQLGGDRLIEKPLSDPSVSALRDFLAGCNVGDTNPCLDGSYDGHAPEAAMAFERGRANALFGYSERLASLSGPVHISPLPLGDEAGPIPLFSDAFVIARACDDACYARALRAIELLVADDTYAWLLARDECGEARPRYLLPAQRSAWSLPVTSDERYRRLHAIVEDGVAFPTRGYRTWRQEVGPTLRKRLAP